MFISCARHRGARNFLGYFLDNELNWWGVGKWWQCGLLDAVLEKLPPDHTARLAAARILAASSSRAEARRAFTEEIAQRYFKTITAAIRRYDPDHLILGVRFAGVAGAPDEVWRICGKFCDAVSLNCYPNADVATGQLSLGVAPALLPKGYVKTSAWTPVPLAVMLRRRYEVCGRPLFIGEWSFRGGDVGRVRKESNGQELPTQTERAQAVRLFLEEMERLPFVVGHLFYKWTDDLFPLRDGGQPETLNWGLVSLEDVPYEKVAAAFRGAKSQFGFSRIEKTPNGWILRDPSDHASRILAIEKANCRGPFCGKTERYPYADALRTQGVTRAAWCDKTTARLHDWGFNMLGTSCDDWLKCRGFAFAEMIAFGARVAQEKDDELFIRPWKGRCCEQFPNVFHPEFRRRCDAVARQAAAKLRNDPNFLGYYLDNELNWWGSGDWYRCGMLDWVLKNLKRGHTAYDAGLRVLAGFGYADAASYLRQKESVRDPIRRRYTEIVAEAYFRLTADALRRYDPNHLILGCRFAGVQGAPDEVWRAAGRHCDVVSFNCYPQYDVTNGLLTVGIHRRPLDVRRGAFHPVELAKEVARLSSLAGKPLFVTEWSFLGCDAGLPCTRGCGQRLATQRLRADAVGAFLDFVGGHPGMIGSAYFKWTDDPALGCSRADPEDGNYGLVNVNDEPYSAVTEMFRRAKGQGERRWMK